MTRWVVIAGAVLAGLLPEAALAAYERAGAIWLIRIRDPGCSLDGIGPRLDEEWAEAGRQLEAART